MTDRRPDFPDALARGPMLLDAAMGTRLIARGLDLTGDDPALWNVSHADDVLDLHRRDIAAGADALLTNTFGANRRGLDRLGRGAEVVALNRRAVALARSAAGAGRFVLGCLGPTAAGDESAHAEQVEALAGAGVDALILETHDPTTAPPALASARRHAPGLPVLVSLWRWPDPTDDLARRLRDLGAAAVGVNCRPWAECRPILGALQGAVDLPILVEPNGGADWPDVVRSVPRGLIGGCCGTTAADIAALRSLIGEQTGDGRPGRV